MDLSSETTLELLARAQAGDRHAFDVVAARLLPRLRRWAARRLPAAARDLSDTDDLVQETLTSVLMRLDDFKPRHEAALTVYVREALGNRLRNEVRRVMRRPPGDSLETVEHRQSPDQSPLEAALTRESLARYEKALAQLDVEDREAIIGRVELQYSYQELAEAWGKPSADAARKTVERAIKRLADLMRHVD